MARFYKTEASNPLDYMYRINTPLMERVIAANDQYIGQNLNQLDALNNAAVSFPYLQADEQRAKEISDQYGKQIDDITATIRKDPANWRNQIDPMRNISRKLATDFKTGEISKISGNYNQYKKVSDYIDKQVEEYSKSGKGISADRARAYKQSFLSDFMKANPNGTAYNAATGDYNSMRAYEPMSNIDITDRLGKEMDKIKADKKLYKKDETTGNEWFFNETTQSWEGVTPEKILNIAMSRLNDPQLQDYLRQDSQVGIISGVYDKQGKFIKPFENVTKGLSPAERQQLNERLVQINKIKDPKQRELLTQQLKQYTNELESRQSLQWNDDSFLSPILKGLLNQYSYSQTEESNKMRDSARGRTLYTQGQINARDLANRTSRENLAKDREKGIQKRFDDNLEFEKYKWEHPHEKTTTASGKSPAKKKEDDKPVIETGVSHLSNQSFNDWSTYDNFGNRIPVLSTEGLIADIDNKKVTIETANSKINNLKNSMKSIIGNRKYEDLPANERAVYDNARIQLEQMQRDTPREEYELNLRRQYYNASTEAALANNPNAGTNLTPDEVALYRKYDTDRQAGKALSEIKDLEKRWMQEWMGAKRAGMSIDDFMNTNISAAYKDITVPRRKELAKYMEIKKRVDDGRDNFLRNVRNQPVIGDAIELNDKDSEAITALIFNNTQGYRLYNQNGIPTDSEELDERGANFLGMMGRGKGAGDNYKMSFVDDELMKYMTKHGVKPKVEQIANGIKLGNGNAVVKVTFNDPNGQIPKVPYYIEVSPEVQRQLGSKFLNNKNKEVAKIAGNILDEEYNDIRKQLISPTIGRVNSAGLNSQDPIQSTIFIRRGGQQIPLYVTKFVSADGVDHLNIQMMKDGKLVPVPLNPNSPNSGIPGWFKDSEDFINQLKTP